MSVSAFVGSFAKRTGTGTQAITGVGFQPKALLFWSVLRTSTGMEAAHQYQVFGVSDGTHHAAMSHASQSGSLATSKGHRNDAALLIVDLAGVVDSIGVVSALGADGFTINWTTAVGSSGVLINFLAIGGSDVTAFVGDVATNSAVGTQAVTGVGFQPDAVVFLAWPFNSAATDASTGFGPNGMGWLTATEQGASSNDTALAVELRRYQRTDRCVVAKGSSGVDYEAAAASLDSGGFTLNWTALPTNGGAHAGRIAYLALKGVYAKAGSLTTPVATGTQTIATAGTLKAVLLMGVGAGASTAVDMVDSEFSFGAVDAAGNQRVGWSADRDAAGTTARYQATTRAVISANSAAGSVTTLESEGSASISSGDFALSWTITTANREQVLYLALGAVAASTYTDGDPGTLAMIALTDRDDVVHPMAPVDLNDPVNYGSVTNNPDGNYKAPKVLSFTPIRRALSNAFGAPEHVSFGAVVSDTDRTLRGLLDDPSTKYLTNCPLVVKTIDDEDRRDELPWRNEMAGYLAEWSPREHLTFELTGCDWLKQKLARRSNAPEFWIPLLTRDDFPNLPTALVNQAAPLWYGRVTDEIESEEGGGSVPADLYPRGAFDPGWLDNGWDGWAISGTIPSDDYALYITAIKDGVESTVIAFEIGFTFSITGGIYARFLTSVTPDYFRIYLSDDTAFNPFTNPTGGSFARYIDIVPDVDAPTDVNPFGPADGSRYYLLSSLTYGADYHALVTGSGSAPLHASKGAVPTLYVGEVSFSGVTKSVFLIGRGAIGHTYGVFVNGVRQSNIGSAYEIEAPYLGDYAATFGANYLDINGTRYSAVLATGSIAINAINGTAPITVNIDGIEDIGDGSGTVLTSPVRIRQHFERNFLAATTVPSTTWLSVAPSLPNDASMQDDDSYDTAEAALVGRVAGGYFVGGGIGVGGQYEAAEDILASLGIAGDFDAGFNRIGQSTVSVEPSAAPATADVIALTDVLHVNDQSFRVQVELTQNFWNVLPFTHTKDYCNRTDTGWYVKAENRDAASLTNYDQERTSTSIDGRWWRNDTDLGHDTLIDAMQRRRTRYRHPLRVVDLTVPYLAAADVVLGSVVRLDAIEGLSATGWSGHDVRVTGMNVDLDQMVVQLTGYDLQPIYDGLDDAVESTEDTLGERLDVTADLRESLTNAQLDITELETLIGEAVTGPASSTDNAIARFDGTGGTTIQNSAITLDDTGALGLPDGIRQTFNPDGTNAGINVGSQAGDPSSLSNGDIWYNSSSSVLKARIGGTTVSFGTGGSGNITSHGTVGSEPGSPSGGDLYFETDGYAVERYTGSVWERFGPLFPFTTPVSGDFAWVNQGGASIDTAKGGIHLIAPAGAGVNLRMRVKTAPATPYTITVAIIPLRPNVDFAAVGLIWRQSSDGKVIVLDYAHSTTSVLAVSKFTNATTFSAVYTSVGWYSTNVIFLRIADNGTNRIASVSNDGQHFTEVHSVGRTDFLTPDQVGFFAHSNNATWPSALTLLSWKEA